MAGNVLRLISTKFNLKNMCSTPWCFGDCEECEADKKIHISDVMFSSFYECGKCKLVSKEHKEHMIENGMLNLVVKHIHLFEN